MHLPRAPSPYSPPLVLFPDPELVRDIAMRHFRCFHDRQRPVRPEALPGDKTLATLYSGMLWTRGELWNSTRGSLKHLFSTGALHSYVPCMNASAEEFLQSIQRSYEAGSAKQSGERAEDEKRRADAPYAAISTPSSPSKYKPLDIHELAGRATMQIVFRAMFGVNIDTSRDGRADRLNSVPNLLEAARVMLESVTVWPQQAAMGLLYTVPRWAEGIVLRLLARAAPGQASADYARTSLNSTTGLLVESARRGAEREGEDVRLRTTDWKWWGPGWETRNLHRHASPHAGSLPRRLALTELRGQGCGLTDAQAASHCSTFISAGYETTANAVAFAVHLLSKHPQHEARLLAEIDQAVGKAEPDAHHLPHCPFVEAVINETLRIYPPAHAVIREVRGHVCDGASVGGRAGGDPVLSAPHLSVSSNRLLQCTQTCEIGNGILIPKGTEMHLAIYTMHHDPRLWHKPEAFRPERFLPGEEADTRHPNAFMPFGIGPRMCIGWRFAMQELMLILIR